MGASDIFTWHHSGVRTSCYRSLELTTRRSVHRYHVHPKKSFFIFTSLLFQYSPRSSSTRPAMSTRQLFEDIDFLYEFLDPLAPQGDAGSHRFGVGEENNLGTGEGIGYEQGEAETGAEEGESARRKRRQRQTIEQPSPATSAEYGTATQPGDHQWDLYKRKVDTNGENQTISSNSRNRIIMSPNHAHGQSSPFDSSATKINEQPLAQDNQGFPIPSKRLNTNGYGVGSQI
jgi:hypothetical protein